MPESSSLHSLMMARPMTSDIIPSFLNHLNQYFPTNLNILSLHWLNPDWYKWILNLEDLSSKSLLPSLRQFCNNSLTKIEILEKEERVPNSVLYNFNYPYLLEKWINKCRDGVALWQIGKENAHSRGQGCSLEKKKKRRRHERTFPRQVMRPTSSLPNETFRTSHSPRGRLEMSLLGNMPILRRMTQR